MSAKTKRGIGWALGALLGALFAVGVGLVVQGTADAQVYSNYSATSIRETGGPTNLSIGAIPDTTVLRRSGTSIIGSTAFTFSGTTATVAGANPFIVVNSTSGVPTFRLNDGGNAKFDLYYSGSSTVYQGKVSGEGHVFNIEGTGSILTLSTTAGTFTVPVRVSNGSATAPSQSFANFTNDGWYAVADNVIGVALDGAKNGELRGSDIRYTGGYIGSFFQCGNADGASGTCTIKDGAGTTIATINTGVFTPAVPVHGPDGTAGAPTYSFTSDTNTGPFSAGADVYGLSVGGSERVRFTTQQQQFGAAGTAGTPNLATTGSTNSGVYLGSPVGFSIAGNSILECSSSAVTVTQPVRGADGSVTAPTYSFTNDTNSGVYSSAADQVSIAAGGAEILRLSGTQTRTGDGGGAAPAFSFISDNDIGMYRGGENDLRFGTGGAERQRITDTAITAAVRFIDSSASVASAQHLPLVTNVGSVTGTTNIDCIVSTGWTTGARVTLIFAAGLTVADDDADCTGGTNQPIQLDTGANFTVTADDTLSLVYDGSKWRETGRSVN